jgi:hypothetical protein
MLQVLMILKEGFRIEGRDELTYNSISKPQPS